MRIPAPEPLGGSVKFSNHHNALSVGNRLIDSQHQMLDGLIVDIGQLMLVNHDVALSAAIRLFHHSLQRYFEIEEDIAQAVGYDFSTHRLAHQELSAHFRAITDKISTKTGRCTGSERKELMDAMSGLLIRHITDDSSRLKIVLETNFYDLGT